MNALTQQFITQISTLPPQEGLSVLADFVAKISTLPDKEKQQTLADFYAFLKKNSRINPINETALLSESVLAIDWNRVEEDDAWAEFQ